MPIAQVDSIWEVIAEILGVETGVVEGSLFTLVLIILVYLAKILLFKEKQDSVQLALTQRLVKLASNAVDESQKLRVSYEANTKLIQQVTEAITTMSDNFVEELKSITADISTFRQSIDQHTQLLAGEATALEDLKRMFIKTSVTHVVIYDSEGNKLAQFYATPEEINGEVSLKVVLEMGNKNE